MYYKTLSFTFSLSLSIFKFKPAVLKLINAEDSKLNI